MTYKPWVKHVFLGVMVCGGTLIWGIGTIVAPTAASPLPISVSTATASLATPSAQVATVSMATSTSNLVSVSHSVTPNGLIATVNVVPTPAIEVTPKPVYSYRWDPRDGFDYPPRDPNVYPDVQLSGFHETRFGMRDYSPKSVTDSRLETIRKDPFYDKLPKDILPGSPKLDMRYKFNVDGKLSKDLGVHYDITHEPDFPDEHDVEIRYQRAKLKFANFDLALTDGELIQIRKSLNGMMFNYDDPNWETTFAYGQLRSKPNKFDGYGNGNRTISLGNRSVLIDSVRVWVNNVPQSAGQDYQLNGFVGEITFNKAMTLTDYIVVVYEFTNPIEDFLPALNRKNFLGAQYLWREHHEAREFPISVRVIGETLKAEGATPNLEYVVAHMPVLLSSEAVYWNKRLLRRNKDYYFKSILGRLVFKPEFVLTKQDLITITYEYREMESAHDYVIGKDSPGPYFLSRRYVMEESVTVSVSGVPLVHQKDYTLDYAKGQLMFSYSIPYGKVVDVTYRANKMRVEVPTKNNAPLSLGVTYATEFVPAQQDTLSNKVATESYVVTSRNYFFTRSTPISVSENIHVSVNGTPLLASQFRVLNAYKGQIELLGLSVPVPYTAQIDYSYVKSYQTNYSFQLKTLDPQSKYSSLNPNHFQLQNTPVKFNGVSYIQLTRSGGSPEQLSSGNEFVVDYGTDGQAITVQFFTSSDPAHRGSRLNTPPGINDVLMLVYDYSPPSSLGQGLLSQRMVGITATNRWTDDWKSRAEVLVSEHNFSKPQSDFTVSFKGSGQVNTSYSLLRTNVVENSEAVFVSDAATSRNVRLNRDSDYIINYTQGTVRFVRATPGTKDSIFVTGKYFDTGTTKAGDVKQKLATKFSTEFVTPELIVKGDFKFIDKDFLPIGDFQEQRGTTLVGGSVDWRPDLLSSYTADYHRRDLFSGTTKDLGVPLYLHQDDTRVGVKYTELMGWLDTKQGVRILSEVRDPDAAVSTINAHAQDDLTMEYTGDYAVGPETFRTILSSSFSQKVTDFLDLKNKGITQTQRVRLDHREMWGTLGFLGKSEVNSFTEFSNSSLDQTQFQTVTRSAQSKGYANRLDMGYVSTFLPQTYLPIRSQWSRSDIRSKSSSDPTENYQVLLNSLYEVGYNPYAWVGSTVTLRHSESASPFLNQQGSLEDQQSYQLNRLAFSGLWSTLGVKATDIWIFPVKDSSLSAGHSETHHRENNSRRISDAENNRYTFANLDILPGLGMRSFSYDDQFLNSLNTEGSTVSSRSYGTSTSIGKTVQFYLTPPIDYFRNFSYKYGFDDRFSLAESRDEALSSTTNRLTDRTPTFKRDQSVAITPGDLSVLIPFLPIMKLGGFEATIFENLSTKINQRTTEQYPTLNVRSPRLITKVLQDNSEIRTYGVTSKYTPFSWLSTSESVKKSEEYYDRNILAGNTGTVYKDMWEYVAGADIQPLSNLKLGASAARTLTAQSQARVIGATREVLDAALSRGDYRVLLDFLRRQQDDIKSSLTYMPFSFLNMDAGAGYTRIFQRYARSSTSDVTTKILQYSGSAGATWLPFSGFSASYLYTLKFNDADGIQSQGYGGLTKVGYTPIQSTGFKVSLSYTREDTWGRDLNTLDRTSTEQGLGNTIQTSVVERNDTVETAILAIDIQLPLSRHSSILDRIVITGEGYLRKITDKRDEFKDIKRSYELSGVLIKGTMFF